MPTREEETRDLDELRDEYVWLVNAALEDGREDIAWCLSDQYLVDAVDLMAAQHPDACERDDCQVCATSGSAVTSNSAVMEVLEPDPPLVGRWWKSVVGWFR